jgi:hypothetical protein
MLIGSTNDGISLLVTSTYYSLLVASYWITHAWAINPIAGLIAICLLVASHIHIHIHMR